MLVRVEFDSEEFQVYCYNQQQTNLTESVPVLEEPEQLENVHSRCVSDA